MSDRRKWGREKGKLANAEKKVIISQHPDAMTGADRQGELQLIAKLSSSLSHCPSPQPTTSLLSLSVISLCTQWENFSIPSVSFDYNASGISAVCVCVCDCTHMRECLCAAAFCLCVCCFSKKLLYWSPHSVVLSKQMLQRSLRAGCLFI